MARRFHDLSSRAQIAIVGVLCVVTATAGGQAAIRPERARIATGRSQVAARDRDVIHARAVATRLSAAEHEVQILETQLRATGALLPEEEDPQDLLRHLHDLASESLLDIVRFAPGAVVVHADYEEWPIELGLEGSYHNLGRFLDRLSAIPRLIAVSNLEIKATTRPNARGTIDTTCVATAFVFQREAQPAAVPLGAPIGLAAPRYEDGGRRDPFVSVVVATHLAVRAKTPAVRGLAGLAVKDVVVRGLARTGGTMLAILEGPSRQSYVAHIQDRLLDGTVLSIDSSGVTFAQQSDSGRPAAVRRVLRPAGGDVR
jgi:type IV pilus assembly protein PilO